MYVPRTFSPFLPCCTFEARSSGADRITCNRFNRGTRRDGRVSGRRSLPLRRGGKRGDAGACTVSGEHERSTSSRGQCQSLVKRETRNWAKVSRRAHRGGQRAREKRGREKEGNTRRNPRGDFIRQTTVSYARFHYLSGTSPGGLQRVCRAECPRSARETLGFRYD